MSEPMVHTRVLVKPGLHVEHGMHLASAVYEHCDRYVCPGTQSGAEHWAQTMGLPKESRP